MLVDAQIIIGDSRKMIELDDSSIHLVITSPPYWSIKDYGAENQIGYGQTLHQYLKDLYRVWKEAYRVLLPGRRLIINIGDQFARSAVYGRYKIIPLHAEIIAQCEEIGFDYMGSIIWQKKTTMNTTGGASVMGSYPYPPNGMVEIDYEFILIFKKPGKSLKLSRDIKEQSAMTKQEWKEYFYGHWYFAGARQLEHQAMFPEELPTRLIKMFSFVGETVLDPFLGSGTTARAALKLNRRAVGYEINSEFLSIIKKKLAIDDNNILGNKVKIISRTQNIEPGIISYQPRIKDAKPIVEPNKLNFSDKRFYKVVDIVDEKTVKLNNGLIVRLLGVDVKDKNKALEYLRKYVLKKEVFLKFDSDFEDKKEKISAYVYLKNKIFVNAQLIKLGIANADRSENNKFLDKFLKLEGKNNG